MTNRFPTGTVESEFFLLLGGDRNAAIAARYSGLDGGGGTSLQKAGDEAGITRERVRQIYAQVIALRLKGSPATPLFDRVISFIEEDLPASAGDIAVALHLRGLTACLFRIEGILEGARLLGRSLSFVVADLGDTIVLRKDDLNLVKPMVRRARLNVRRWGMTTATDVAESLMDSGLTSRREVHRTRSILAAQRNIRWLDEGNNWFWLTDIKNNPVVRRMQKILAVAGSLPLQALADAIRRHPRMRSFNPPGTVFREFCRQLPSIRVEGDLVCVAERTNPSPVLSRLEETMVGILAAHGGALERAQIVRFCKRRGISPFTVNQYLKYSPIFCWDRTADVYSLIGR